MRQPLVYLVEDDQTVRESLAWTLRRSGFAVRVLSDPGQLLEAYDPQRPGCLILDLKLPGMSGLDLLEMMIAQGHEIPFIILTGCGDLVNVIRAMRLGVIDFLEKPPNNERLLKQTRRAIDQDIARRRENVFRNSVERRINLLSKREREVLHLVVEGKLTKQIARDLDVSIKTIEAHRSNITRKMQVQSVTQLVRLMTTYELSTQQRAHQRHGAGVTWISSTAPFIPSRDDSPNNSIEKN